MGLLSRVPALAHVTACSKCYSIKGGGLHAHMVSVTWKAEAGRPLEYKALEAILDNTGRPHFRPCQKQKPNKTLGKEAGTTGSREIKEKHAHPRL